jgi:RNA polymerase sigma-70 factor (ECF subfamily)
MSRKFRKWVAEYQDQAWTLARYLLKDPAEAEDACQDAFIKLWHNRDSIDPDKVKPWLMKVTHQVPGPMQGLHQHEQGEWLKARINRLKEPYRSLVVLRDVHQHSYEEVAGVLELNLSQVKTYLHRARKQLREQLAEVRP